LIWTAASASLRGDQLVVRPNPATFDDRILIHVHIDDLAGAPDTVSVPLSGLALVDPFQRRSFRAVDFIAFAVPTQSGAAKAGPVTYQRGGKEITIAAVNVTIRPPPAINPANAAKSIEMMAASGLVPIFLRVEPERKSVYAGQSIILSWTAVSREKPAGTKFPPIPVIPGGNARELSVNPTPEERDRDNLYVWPVRKIVVTPSGPGTMTIEPLEVAFEFYRQRPKDDFENSSRRTVKRVSPPATLTVQPVSVKYDVVTNDRASLFVTKQKEREGSSPCDFTVTLSGWGDLSSSRAPRFAGSVSGTVSIRDLGTSFDASRYTSSHRWLFHVSGPRARMIFFQDIVLDRFDPDSGRVVTMRTSAQYCIP